MLSAQRNAPALGELESALRTVRGWERDPSGVEIAAQLAGLVQTKSERLGDWQGACLVSSGTKR